MMHYFGYKLHEIEQLSAANYAYLMKVMEHAKAQDRLELLELIVYPNSKDKTQAAIHKRLSKAAVPAVEMEKRAVKTDDLKNIFGSNIEDFLKGK